MGVRFLGVMPIVSFCTGLIELYNKTALKRVSLVYIKILRKTVNIETMEVNIKRQRDC